jgi:hypothetical protein
MFRYDLALTHLFDRLQLFSLSWRSEPGWNIPEAAVTSRVILSPEFHTAIPKAITLDDHVRSLGGSRRPNSDRRPSQRPLPGVTFHWQFLL